MSDEKLNELYKAYRAGDYDRTGFEGRLFKHILEHHKSYGIFEKDTGDCSDFLSWIYPRFSKSIDRYVPVYGVNFSAFIHSIIRFGFKEYRSLELRRREKERVVWSDVARSSRHYEEEWYEGEKECSKIPQQSQTLMVLLKSYYAVSDDLIDRAAEDLGLTRDTLKTMIEALRKEREDKEATIKKLSDSCKTQYYRCLCEEDKLYKTERGTLLWNRISEQLAVHKRRLANMRLRLKNMRLEATNSQVAKVMGIPKGTVDSGIYAFKRKYIKNQTNK